MQTILIAEKSEVFAKSLVDALRSKYQVHTCSRGDTALELLESLHPDILIIDLILPHRDGVSVLKVSKYTLPCILALATAATNFVLQSAKDAGVQNVLLLPCTVEAVTRQLEEMLHMGSFHFLHIEQNAAHFFGEFQKRAAAGFVVKRGISGKLAFHMCSGTLSSTP